MRPEAQRKESKIKTALKLLPDLVSKDVRFFNRIAFLLRSQFGSRVHHGIYERVNLLMQHYRFALRRLINWRAVIAQSDVSAIVVK